MANRKLEFLQVLHAFFDDVEFESDLEEADDGKNHSMDDGRIHALELLDQHIDAVNELKKDIAKMNLQTLKRKYIIV